LREDGAFQLYRDQDGRYYFVLIEEEKESDVALEVATSRVFRGETIAALKEDKTFQNRDV
jgi:hypothetical protein